MKKLQITLKKKWFDMIASGDKKKEYREIKWYWIIRMFVQHEDNNMLLKQFMEALLKGEDMEASKYRYRVSERYFSHILATNGYSGRNPSIRWEHWGTSVSFPNPEWCEPEDVGKRLLTINIGNVCTIQK